MLTCLTWVCSSSLLGLHVLNVDELTIGHLFEAFIHDRPSDFQWYACASSVRVLQSVDEWATGQAKQGILKPKAAPHGCFGPDSFQDFFGPLLSHVTALQESFTMKASQCPWPSSRLKLLFTVHYNSFDRSSVWLPKPASSLFPRLNNHCSWCFLVNFVLSTSVSSYWWLDQRLMSLAEWYILAHMFLDYLNTTNLRDRHTLSISTPSSFE